MSGVVQSRGLRNGLKMTAHILVEDILASALSKDDARFEPASNLLVRSMWKGCWEREADVEDFELDANAFCEYLSDAEGRVLTVIEGIFPSGQQCEALKSLARQEVWETRKRVDLKDFRDTE